MDGELNNKIKEIGSMFGIENIPDNIGDIVSAFLNKDDIVSDDENQNVDNNTQKDITKKVEDENFINLFKKLSSSNLNKKNDKKIQLLYAIQPFLNDKRKEKINNCVKFLIFADIAKDMKLI